MLVKIDANALNETCLKRGIGPARLATESSVPLSTCYRALKGLPLKVATAQKILASFGFDSSLKYHFIMRPNFKAANQAEKEIENDTQN